MTQKHAMSVQQLYQTQHQLQGQGVQGYRVFRNYFDAQEQIQKRQQQKKKKGEKVRRHVTKRGSYIEDQQKLHKSVPGPGKYTTPSQWPQKPQLKVRYPDKKTFIDQIFQFQKKWKRPAPGHYKTEKSLKEIQVQNKLLASRKIRFQDKINFLDDSQFRSSQYPGSGNYNPRDRIKTQYSKRKTKPEEWRKKHELLAKRKPPKYTSYTPLPADITLFEHIKDMKKSKNTFSKAERFRTTLSGSGIAPIKYSILQKWRGKGDKKLEKHGFETLSNTMYRSVYH